MSLTCEFPDCDFPYEQHAEACIRADEREQVRKTVRTMLEAAKRERDGKREALMRDDPYGYGERMWYGGRATGIAEVLGEVR